MKKSLKYLGATAAALLAVAPVAAPAVASVASFGVAHAAEAPAPAPAPAADPAADFAGYQAAVKDLANFKSSITVTSLGDLAALPASGEDYSALTTAAANVVDPNKNSLYTAPATAPTTTSAKATVTVKDAQGNVYNSDAITNTSAAKKTFFVTIVVSSSDSNATTATSQTTIVVNYDKDAAADPAKVENPSATYTKPSFKIGDASALASDPANYGAVTLSSFDKKSSYTFATTTAKLAAGTSSVADQTTGKFTKAGTFTATFTFSLTAEQAAALVGTSKGNSVTLANGDSLTIDTTDNEAKLAETITVGDATDAAKAQPVVTYTPSGTGTTPVTVADGATVQLSKADQTAVNSATTGVPFQVGSADTTNNSLAKAVANAAGANAVVKLTAKDPTNSTTPDLTSAISVDTAAALANAKKAGVVAQDVTDGNAATFTGAGSFLIPVTVKGLTNLTTTVYVPVTVLAKDATPATAVAWAGLDAKTIKVGSTFDKAAALDGVTATSVDGSAIDAAKITVDLSKVDTTKAGSYIISYSAFDPATGKVSDNQYRTINVIAAPAVKEFSGNVYATQDNATLYTLKDGVLTANASSLSGKKDSAWKAFATLEQNGVTYYKLGSDSQWAKAVTTDKPAPASDVAVVSDFTGVVYANVAGGSPVYTLNAKTGEAVYTGRTLPQGTAWKGFKKAVVGDVTYVNLGGNQWIKDFGASYTTKVSGVATLKHSAALYSNDAVLTARTLAKGSRYKVSAKVQLNGVTYYQIGGLVKASDVSFR